MRQLNCLPHRRSVFFGLLLLSAVLHAEAQQPSDTRWLYAQPFFASGDYFNFKELDASRQLHKSIHGKDRGTIAATKDGSGHETFYTIDPDGAGPASAITVNNPDFNVRSLRGNAGFRWECNPGSTVYLVWTQERTDQSDQGDFDFARDRDALRLAHADNIFLVKLSYWLGRQDARGLRFPVATRIQRMNADFRGSLHSRVSRRFASPRRRSIAFLGCC